MLDVGDGDERQKIAQLRRLDILAERERLARTAFGIPILAQAADAGG
jgi:hypothetical protein